MFVKCRRPPILRDAQGSLGGQGQHLIQTAGTRGVGEGGGEGTSIPIQDELGLDLPREENNA